MAIRNEILRRRLARLTMIAAAHGDGLAPGLATAGMRHERCAAFGLYRRRLSRSPPDILAMIVGVSPISAIAALRRLERALERRRLLTRRHQPPWRLPFTRRRCWFPARWRCCFLSRLFAGDASQLPSALIGQTRAAARSDGARRPAGRRTPICGRPCFRRQCFRAPGASPATRNMPTLLTLAADKTLAGKVSADRRRAKGRPGEHPPFPRRRGRPLRQNRLDPRRPRRHRLGRLWRAGDLHRQRRRHDRLQTRRADDAGDAEIHAAACRSKRRWAEAAEATARRYLAALSSRRKSWRFPRPKLPSASTSAPATRSCRWRPAAAPWRPCAFPTERRG